MLNNKTFIIAEAGANHDQNFDQAIELIDVAVEAGADAVKFQTYSSETLYSKNTPDFANYKDLPKLIKSLELPREWQKDLKQYCDENNIEFMSTPFDEQAVDELCNIGVKRFKIAGFESTDPRIVKYIASTGKPLIISAGIGNDLNTIENIVKWVMRENLNPDITILHCNNAYPTPLEDINLGQMKRIKDKLDNMKWGIKRDKDFVPTVKNLKIKIGLSDHTEGILVPPLAVSMGAQVIEKHFTLSRDLEGPDHTFALEADELKEMVKNIRLAEKTLGIKENKFTPSEKEFKEGTRSVIAKKDIKPDEVLNENNITTKRPFINNAIPARDYYDVLGRKSRTYIEEDSIITKGLLKN